MTKNEVIDKCKDGKKIAISIWATVNGQQFELYGYVDNDDLFEQNATKEINRRIMPMITALNANRNK